MSKVVYSGHIEPMPKGGFYITVPVPPDCRWTARSFDLALNKAKKQIETHLRFQLRARKRIPIECQKVRPVCVPINVNLPKGAETVLASVLSS